MKSTSTIYLIAFFLGLAAHSGFSQGCVAVRSGCGANVAGGAVIGKGQWMTGSNFRYFQSYKHFRGKTEETHRVGQGSEVINDSYFTDLFLSYGISDRLTANFVLPFVYYNRTSMYEHGGNPRADDPETPDINEAWAGDRNATSAGGLADIRFSVNYWLLDPAVATKTNFSIGLGVKLRTGDYRAQDTYYNQGPNKEGQVVADADQSILPGDGGVGATFDFQGYHTLTERLIATGNFYYLSNPRESFSFISRNGSISQRSVSDQYAARLGAVLVAGPAGLSFYGGGRVEGVPSSDLIGGDEGGRRPGYAISVEPGVNYGFRNMSFSLTVPVAVERNRVQSFSDKQATKETGEYTIGDAAFADYLVNFAISYRFGGMKHQTIDVNDFSGTQN